MKLPPKRKDESILTPAMLQTIFGTAAFFVVVMLGTAAGHGVWRLVRRRAADPTRTDWEFGPLKIRQVSIFFSIYIFFQVWNQINCRALTPETSGFSGLLQNRTFLAIVGTVAVGQVLLTSLPPLAAIFKVEPLGWLDWLGIVAFTATVLVFAEVWRLGAVGEWGEAGAITTGGMSSWQSRIRRWRRSRRSWASGRTSGMCCSAPGRTAAAPRRE